MTQLILLVGGQLTSGKDTFADHLVDKHGFVKLGMSDTLAEALRRQNPWIHLDIDFPEDNFLRWGAGNFVKYQDLLDRAGYNETKKLAEVRLALQLLGTEVGRELLGKNIWVDAARSRINEQLAAGAAGVVLTGIRFPNELALENSWVGSGRVIATTVWVERPGLEHVVSTHSSEGSVGREDFEYSILNDGTIEDLHKNSDGLLGTIRSDYA